MSECWSYQGANGPDNWCHLNQEFCDAAAFPFQSPINIERQEKQFSAPFSELTFNYQETTFNKKQYGFSVHHHPVDRQNYIISQTTAFYLTDVHFHIPSEHTFNNEREELECHLVHKDNHGRILVIGVLCRNEVDANLADDYRMMLEAIVSQDEVITFNPALFLPDNCHFYHYTGSLTTPPTVGPVEWYVADTVQAATAHLCHHLTRIAGGKNSRPAQPLNNRYIDYQ